MKTHLSVCILLTALLLNTAAAPFAPNQQTDNPNPPDHIVKLIFIHHSTGENWLADGYGNLGRTLAQSNYFVSDTNYGWGPDSIGDRTDIPNWTEWFASRSTPTYMNALFNESGQNAEYTRTLPDPGGDNQIVMFKSCFPNSELEGNPNDPPGTYEELSVRGAKYVYNTILKYFATRPDKLFIIITAPPVSNPEYSDNARAFNNWLINDWLRENNYTLNNVAVFDFYNILTDNDAHHRVNNGQVEHLIGNSNTLAYPSGDDHPSERGSQKATDEFVPMLNFFYHRWQEDARLQTPSPPATPAGEGPQTELYPAQTSTGGLIDDFEGQPPAGTAGWESYFQDNTDTQLRCELDFETRHAGLAALQFQFDVAASSWATCGFYFDEINNWSTGQGLAFYLRADRAGIPFDIDLYGGDPGGRITYVLHTETVAESVHDWALIEIRWDDILRAEWEEKPGTPFDPNQVTGFSIGLSTSETERLNGTIWLDDLTLLGNQPASTITSPAEENPSPEVPEPSGPAGPSLPCGGAIILPLALAVLKGKTKKHQ